MKGENLRIVEKDIGHADGGVMNRKWHRYAFFDGVLFVGRGVFAEKSCKWLMRGVSNISEGQSGSRTTVTSSPTTVTSGLRKCLRAVTAARQAQSNALPA